ncbi:gliding motility-associated protein GldE [Apibacter adventoris]|uniref:Gliding motility-associated protein GldE n=1 Tax=Apibacter adventoris TaxID=1679466 RepID=A0A2S8A9A2_9FLAO|nr:gliding motility-associated protein GldE [Apibacter adventoris]PQL91056.1 gliding motility-associated protein GldE [Apibacter adventoris]
MDDPGPTSLLLTIFYQFPSELYIITGTFIIFIILIFVTSGSKEAILSLSQKDLDKYQKDYFLEVKAITKIRNNSNKFISTILVFKTLINLGLILISIKFCDYFANYFQFSKQIIFFLNFFIIVFILIFIGEIIPKMLVLKNTFLFSCKTLKFIHFITTICSPITYLFSLIIKNTNENIKLGGDNLAQTLVVAKEEKNISVTELKILEGIINFVNTETSQVMTPRIDVFAIQKSTPFKTLINLISKNGYSRIPVYDKNIDDIIGILHIKDLFQYIEYEQLEWNFLLKKPYFIPENKKIDNLLADFKKSKMHLAIVVDEYGGTSGIVSLEDVIEEIVGEINDEFDENNIIYSKINDHVYVFEGKTSIIDFCRIMGINEKEFESVQGEADTLAGLVLELTEEFPKKLQNIYYKNYIFQVESLDRKRLKQIKITRKIDNEE